MWVNLGIETEIANYSELQKLCDEVDVKTKELKVLLDKIERFNIQIVVKDGKGCGPTETVTEQ